jgi:hypothetical protein
MYGEQHTTPANGQGWDLRKLTVVDQHFDKSTLPASSMPRAQVSGKNQDAIRILFHFFMVKSDVMARSFGLCVCVFVPVSVHITLHVTCIHVRCMDMHCTGVQCTVKGKVEKGSREMKNILDRDRGLFGSFGLAVLGDLSLALASCRLQVCRDFAGDYLDRSSSEKDRLGK